MNKAEQAQKILLDCENRCAAAFKTIEEIALVNQKKVLDAFINHRVGLRHFVQSSGYAYGDAGRMALAEVFAEAFGAEDAIVSPLFASGTHTITVALFGILRPGDTVLSLTGAPYNTLQKVTKGVGTGSLKDFGINFVEIPLFESAQKDQEKDGFDYKKIKEAIEKHKPRALYIQRARGYTTRRALRTADIAEAAKILRPLTDAPIIVDNCYGEFVEKTEPTQAGANLIIGSLIKNPGGGLAPTGGYIAGDKALIEQIAGRYSAPGVGFDIGAFPSGYQYLFQGFFMAPHVVSQALKSSVLFGEAFLQLGYEIVGAQGKNSLPADITCAIKFDSAADLVRFCKIVQSFSPVDSFAVPEPTDMPGYAHPIIMAGGTFVQGSSIELSADGPVKPPFIAYLQGALSFEHAKIVLKEALEAFI